MLKPDIRCESEKRKQAEKHYYNEKSVFPIDQQYIMRGKTIESLGNKLD